MVLQAFFDESGNAPNQRLLAVGGLLARAENWVSFAEQWAAALRKPPGAAFAKYSEITRLAGEFGRERGWTEPLRDERLAELVGIITRNCIGLAFAAMEHEHFEKYVQSVPAAYRSLLNDHPYAFVATGVVPPTVAILRDAGITDPCDFYFDECDGPHARMVEQWPDTKRSLDKLPEKFFPKGRPVIGSIRFENEGGFVPIQAADLVAGMVRDSLMGSTPHDALAPLNKVAKQGRLYSEAEVQESGQALMETQRALLERFPDGQLFDYEGPAAAKRLRKRLERLLARNSGR